MSTNPVRDRLPPPPPNHGNTVRARAQGEGRWAGPALARQAFDAVQTMLAEGLACTDIVRLCELSRGYEQRLAAIGRGEEGRIAHDVAMDILDGYERYGWGDRSYKVERTYTPRQPRTRREDALPHGARLAQLVRSEPDPSAPRPTLRERMAAKYRGE